MMLNKCPSCRNCIVACYQVEYTTEEGFDPVTMSSKKTIKQKDWVKTFTCKFGVKGCPGIQKCSHYKKA